MPNKASLFPLLIMLFVVSVLLLGFWGYGYSRLVMTYPVIAGVITSLFCLLIFVNDIRSNTSDSTQADDPVVKGRRRLVRNFVSMAAIVPVVAIGGLLAGPFVYLLLFLKLRGESWAVALALAGGTLLFIYLVFVRFLEVTLVTGVLGI